MLLIFVNSLVILGASLLVTTYILNGQGVGLEFGVGIVFAWTIRPFSAFPLCSVSGDTDTNADADRQIDRMLTMTTRLFCTVSMEVVIVIVVVIVSTHARRIN